MTDKGIYQKVTELKTQVEALEQLLATDEQAVLEQTDKLERALAALQEAKLQLPDKPAETDPSSHSQSPASDVTESKQAEADLAKFKMGIERSTDAFFLTDVEGTITYVNPAFEKIYGFNREEAVGQNPRIIKSGLIPQEAYQHFWEKLLSGGTVSGEIVNKAKDGRLVYVAGSNNPIMDEAGNLIGFFAIHRDITEQREAEDSLQEITTLQQAIVDNAEYAIISTTPDGIITMFNPAAERLLGYAASEVVGKETPAILHVSSEIRERAKVFSEELGIEIEPGFEVFIAKARQNLPNQHEWTYIRKDGSRFPVLLAVTALRDAEDNITGFLGIAQDVTERKQAEDTLQRERALLHSLIDSVPDLIFYKDREGIYLGCNQAFAEFVGRSENELVGQTDFSLFPTDVAEFFREQDQLMMAQKEARSNEEWVDYPDGRRVLLDTLKTPFYDTDGDVIGLIGISRDITERKEAEESLRASQQRFELVMEGSNEGLWDWNIPKNEVYFSPQWKAIIGHEDHEIANDFVEFESRLHPEDHDRVMGTVTQYLEGKLSQFETEFRFQHKDGFYRWILARASLLRDSDGNPIRMAGSHLDITERKQAEALLAKRASELETVAEVGTAAATILETDRLLQEVADLTKGRFGLYHAHIYLLDEAGASLELAAGAGEVGRRMVAKGWSIPLDREQSLVAEAAREGRGVIANDVQAEPDFMPNPLLPETRAEMAVPMIIGERVVGVLDVQADVVDRFTAEDVQIQTALAAQIAVALESARLLEQTQQASLQLQKRVKELDCLNDVGQEMELAPPIPELLQWVTERLPQAMRYPELCVVAIEYENQVYGAAEAVRLPFQMTHGLYIGGEILGKVYIAYTQKHDFLDEESALLGAVATRLSGYIENRRLFAQTQARARQEQILRQVSDRIRGSVDVETIMRTAAREVGQALGRPAFVYLGNGDTHQESPVAVDKKDT